GFRSCFGLLLLRGYGRKGKAAAAVLRKHGHEHHGNRSRDHDGCGDTNDDADQGALRPLALEVRRLRHDLGVYLATQGFIDGALELRAKRCRGRQRSRLRLRTRVSFRGLNVAYDSGKPRLGPLADPARRVLERIFWIDGRLLARLLTRDTHSGTPLTAS